MKPSPWPLLACYGSMMAMAISVNLAPVYFTTFSEAFGGPAGLTEEQLGRISAVVFAATVAGILVTGPLADRSGGKVFALLGLALTSAGLCLLARAVNYGMLLTAVAVMGFGGGILDMVLSPIVCALRPERRSQALNWLHAFYCIGALGTVLAASAALHLALPWRGFVLAMNAAPVLVFLAFLPLRIPPLVHESADRTPLAFLLTRPFFLAALAAIALCGATEQGMAQWLPAYAERSLGYSKAVGGLALAGFSVCMIVGRVAAGVILGTRKLIPPRSADSGVAAINSAGIKYRVPRITMMLTGCAGCVLGYLVGCFIPVSPVALAACVAIGMAVSCLWPTTLSLAADRFPHGGASMFSLMTAAGNLGCFFMPWLVGVVAERASLPLGMAAATACPLLLAAILIRIVPGRRR